MNLGIKDIILILLIAGSSISLIDARHVYRVLYDESQKQIQYQQKIKREIIDYKKLLSKLKDKARIESIAENDLGMIPVSSKNTIILEMAKDK